MESADEVVDVELDLVEMFEVLWWQVQYQHQHLLGHQIRETTLQGLDDTRAPCQSSNDVSARCNGRE